jgi:hypothetical protein
MKPILLAVAAVASLAISTKWSAAQSPAKARAAAVFARGGQPGLQIPEQQIDNWVFRQDRSPQMARQRQENLLKLKIDELNRACRLTPEQSKKLFLTGQGDIKRFFDRYEALKEKFQGPQVANQDANEIFQETNPLSMSLQNGLFQSGSLLYRAMPNTLTSAQIAAYDAIVRERLQLRHAANIGLLVTTLEEAVPLPDAQRQKLLAFLKKEIKPSRITGPYDFYYLMFQLGEIPEDKLKPLFDVTQWRAVDRFVNQYKGMEPTLRQAGYFQAGNDDAEKEDADATPKK